MKRDNNNNKHNRTHNNNDTGFIVFDYMATLDIK